MTEAPIVLTASQWRVAVKGRACIRGDDGRVDLVAVTELGEARVACEDGHEWVLAGPSALASKATGREGKLEDLGVYRALLDTFRPDEVFVEYAIVEHRFAAANRALYAKLVREYGHTAIAPRRYTVSSLLAGALSHLERDGSLARESGPATGRWSYNVQVSYWALPPAREGNAITWEGFATDHGLDPATWAPTHGLSGPLQ